MGESSDEWEELIESAPKAYEQLKSRMIADPSAPWRDTDAQSKIGSMLAYSIGTEFESEKKLFRKAAAQLLSQCSGDVAGLKSVIQSLYRTSWLSWARKQNSPYSLLNSIRRAWKREQFLAEPRRRRLVENLITEIADALDKPYEQVAWSCLQGVIVLLEMYGEKAVEEAFFSSSVESLAGGRKSSGKVAKSSLARWNPAGETLGIFASHQLG